MGDGRVIDRPNVGFGRSTRIKRGNGIQQPAPVPDRRDPEVS
jgi:hypothetical protein